MPKPLKIRQKLHLLLYSASLRGIRASRSAEGSAGKRTSLVRNTEAYNGSADSRKISAKIEYAAMAQQVEHVLGKDEVTGSNPVSSSIKTTIYGGFSFVFNAIYCV